MRLQNSETTEWLKNINCFIDYTKAFDCVDHYKLEDPLLKRRECQTTWPASWETCMQVKKPQLELDMEQLTGQNGERSTKWQGCIPSPYLFNFYAEYFMLNTRLDES